MSGTGDIVRAEEDVSESGRRMGVVLEIGVPSKPNWPAMARVEEDANLRPGDLRRSTSFSQFENCFDERNEILGSILAQKAEFHERDLHHCPSGSSPVFFRHFEGSIIGDGRTIAFEDSANSQFPSSTSIGPEGRSHDLLSSLPCFRRDTVGIILSIYQTDHSHNPVEQVVRNGRLVDEGFEKGTHWFEAS